MQDNLVNHIHKLERLVKEAMVAEQLLCDPNFKLVFEQGYCNEYLVELVDKRATCLTEQELVNLAKRIDSIAYFRQYLQQLRTAKDQRLAELQQAKESLTQQLASNEHD